MALTSGKPCVLVLATPNQSRVAHFRKLAELAGQYDFIGVCIGKGRGWEPRFVKHWIELDTGTPWDQADIPLLRQLPRIHGIVNISEAYVPMHANLCERLGLIGPDREAVAVGRNKYKMRQ